MDWRSWLWLWLLFLFLLLVSVSTPCHTIDQSETMVNRKVNAWNWNGCWKRKYRRAHLRTHARTNSCTIQRMMSHTMSKLKQWLPNVVANQCLRVPLIARLQSQIFICFISLSPSFFRSRTRICHTHTHTHAQSHKINEREFYSFLFFFISFHFSSFLSLTETIFLQCFQNIF